MQHAHATVRSLLDLPELRLLQLLALSQCLSQREEHVDDNDNEADHNGEKRVEAHISILHVCLLKGTLGFVTPPLELPLGA